jgi:hypothetical protein
LATALFLTDAGMETPPSGSSAISTGDKRVTSISASGCSILFPHQVRQVRAAAKKS